MILHSQCIDIKHLVGLNSICFNNLEFLHYYSQPQTTIYNKFVNFYNMTKRRN